MNTSDKIIALEFKMMSMLYLGRASYEQCYKFKIIDKKTAKSQNKCILFSDFIFPSQDKFPEIDYSLIPGTQNISFFSNEYLYDPRNLINFDCDNYTIKYTGVSYKPLLHITKLQNKPNDANNIHEYFAYSVLMTHDNDV